MSCDCGRNDRLCVRGDLVRCPLWDEVIDDSMADDSEQDINCGLQANGCCSLAGTEWCDWSCPHNDEARHNKAIRRRYAKPTPLFGEDLQS